MTLKLSVLELAPPLLQFGGPASTSDPKVGLEVAGPFDMRFGAARKNQINVGLIGPGTLIDKAREWIERCNAHIPVLGAPNGLRRPFPGFRDAFRRHLVVDDSHVIRIDSETRDPIAEALECDGEFVGFQRVLDAYAGAHARLAARDANRPDMVVICLPKKVTERLGLIERAATEEERDQAAAIKKARQSSQLDFFDMFEQVEQTEEDFLKRNLRHALKAKALAGKLPIQIATEDLLVDGARNQDPATRAWNFCVGVYYKAGGVPWRLPPTGPETCFVGVSFHHFRSTKRHIVQSSLAQAFSSDGEGFAIRGDGIPAEPDQRLNLHLSEAQAHDLARDVVEEYATRTGGAPLRVVMHKTSHFDAAEEAGLRAALRDIPLVSFVTLVPSAFRLMRFGAYPPKVGTVCTINDDRTFLFTSGFMPELGTYPGPHVPQPFEVRCLGDDHPLDAAAEVLNLTRMNWNTADIRGKWPVTLSFARRVGGILDEFGEGDPEESSFRYFI